MTRRSPVPKTGWRKHFDGWQLAIVLAVCAAAPALLAVPHATVSREIPLPTIDRAEQYRAQQHERELIAQAALPYAARAIGEALRRYGALRAKGESSAANWVLTDIRNAVVAAQRDQQLPTLLQLRAVQTQLFLVAIDRLRTATAATPDPELLELGGEFLKDARDAGWLTSQELYATNDELRAWFVIRWNVLTQLTQQAPFAASLNDWRTYYRFLLRDDHAPPGAPQADAVTYRARVLDALAQKDPDYPIDLGRGLLSCQRSDYGACSDLLQRHLQRSPDGPWSLRARSTLKVATAALRAQRR
ncbi:MAG TPA: hypothetical protein VHO25_17710 [Polyangiaceae bacterium]|nr:hypothetical protein [Polyangiaceae bacterium]